MKRSRASLSLLLVTWAASLQTIGLANVHYGGTAEIRPLRNFCSADWSPIGDRHIARPQRGSMLLSSHVEVANTCLLDACHPESLTYYAASNQGPHCFDYPLSNDQNQPVERDAYVIDEFIYGDPAAAVRAARARGYVEPCADDFDCGLTYQPPIHREDITAVTNHPGHSTGLKLALDLNAQSEGLTSAPGVQDRPAPRLAAQIGANYDYGDCDYGCYDGSDIAPWDFSDVCAGRYASKEDRDDSVPVVTRDKEPHDLPPAEIMACKATDASSQYDEYNYEDDYSGYASDVSTAWDDTSEYDAYAAVTEEPSDLPPGEQIIDDMPPGEQLVDDLPPGEHLVDDLPPGEQLVDDMPPGERLVPVYTATRGYDVERYGDYADLLEGRSAWQEPGCDEQQSFADRQYRASEIEQTRDCLRSTAWLLQRMGEALVSLSKSLDCLAEPIVASRHQLLPPREVLYPWPATLSRQPEVDPPLGL